MQDEDKAKKAKKLNKWSREFIKFFRTQGVKFIDDETGEEITGEE